MKTYLGCYPCFLRQALEAAHMAGADEEQQVAILDRVLNLLTPVDLSTTPPEISARLHEIVRRETGAADPYRATKEAANRQALKLYPRLKALVAGADDPLERALRIAIAGNIIDLGVVSGGYDLWDVVEQVLVQPFAVDGRQAFREALVDARGVLYLADNAGETVFDRVLIETLDVPVTYAVKGAPILNDATLDDALAVGIDGVTAVVSTGSQAPGTILGDCSEAFRHLYAGADLIISKGQANYETLSENGDTGGRVFFLLKTKCPVIAGDLGVPVGSIVLKQREA